MLVTKAIDSGIRDHTPRQEETSFLPKFFHLPFWLATVGGPSFSNTILYSQMIN